MLLLVFRVLYIDCMSMSIIQWVFFSYTHESNQGSFQYTIQQPLYNSAALNLDVGEYNRDSSGEIDLIWRY